MKILNYKTGIILGIILVAAAIVIGLIFQNDIGFVITGIGVIIIGISILSYINKPHNGDK